MQVAYLSQEPTPPSKEASERSALENLLNGVMRKRKVKLEEERVFVEEQLDSHDTPSTEVLERLDEISLELDEVSSYAARETCKEILSDLGFDEERMNANVSTLSGGWRMRVELGEVMNTPSRRSFQCTVITNPPSLLSRCTRGKV
jgi:ATPase subunit of ABC transporter with duplicated ATPase domains